MISLFIVALGFSKTLVHDRTKCLFLNDEPGMVRAALIDINLHELKYYLFMINLNKCNEISNVLCPKIYVSKEKKEIYAKALNMMTNKDEDKVFHVIVIKNSIVQHVIQNQKQNQKSCKCESKNYRKCEKGYIWNPSTCTCKNKKYSKSIVNTSVTKCNEIVTVMNNLSRK